VEAAASEVVDNKINNYLKIMLKKSLVVMSISAAFFAQAQDVSDD
jgi:hypothetical protein